MNAKEILSKTKPLIIIILLFSVVFLLRADAVHLSAIPNDMKPLFEDQNGLPYFTEIDSYYNLRMTQDYLDHGYMGDTIQNGIHWDLHSYYPSGRSAEYRPLIVYITAFTYKLVNSFANMPLNVVAIWVAPFVASLAVIPAYLFVRRLTNDYGGITAGLLVGLAPAYFQHTFAGFFDTDQFNMLIPILIIGFFIVSILAKDIKTRTIYISLSAISLLIYSIAWEFWGYIFYLLVGTGIIYLFISNYLFKMKTLKSFKEYSSKINWFLDQPALFSLIMFIVVSFLLLNIYWGFSGFIGELTRIIGATQLQNAVQSTAYPNIFISVRELQPVNLFSWGSLLEVIKIVGGTPAVAFSILSVLWFIWKLKPDADKNLKEKKAPKKKNKPRRRGKRTKLKVVEEKIEKNNIIIDPQVMEKKKNYLLYAVLFSIWLLVFGYAITKGLRFAEQLSVPIALSAGIFVGLIAPYFAKQIKNTRYCTLAVLLLIALVAYTPASEAYKFSNSMVAPELTDPLYDSMGWIKNNTPENTVLTSWWDFGHLFTVVADRPVTFDGGSQNTPRAYWVGRALFTDNEDLSAGILRMLTSSGDQGILTLENYTKDTGKSVEILNKILPVDKQKAQTILTNDYKLSLEQAQNVLQYTHPDNPSPHKLILSPDMIGKAGVWAGFGNWNFQKGIGPGYGEPGYGYSAAMAGSKQVNGTTVIQAQNNVVAQVNGSKITAGLLYEQNNQTQIIEPHKLIVVKDGKVLMNQLVSKESPISIVIIKENNSYLAVAMSKELEDSMFTKLYFMNGAGLNKFKLAHAEGGVMVWNAS